jgi:hypothetical protein
MRYVTTHFVYINREMSMLTFTYMRAMRYELDEHIEENGMTTEPKKNKGDISIYL